MIVKTKLCNVKNKIVKNYFWKKYSGTTSGGNYHNEELLLEYSNTINENMTYSVEIEKVPQYNEKHKWVGGQAINSIFYAIPNDSESILIHDTNSNRILPFGQKGLFKWTGGGIWNDKLYCFPRSANSFLILDYHTNTIEYLKLDYNYNMEHHYGGIITPDGLAYQPPRNTDHILETDLKTGQSKRIYLSNKYLNMKYRYCASVLYPGGYIFFLPERNDKVIKFNYITKKVEYIGETVTPYVFDAKIWIDGNIYGFSAYTPGMLKIDINLNTVEMIHTGYDFAAYGTKLGINGKLYSIPGDGKVVWEFNPKSNELKKLFEIYDDRNAKYAGGATGNDGKIYFSPASADTIMILKPNISKIEINSDVYETYYKDFY